MNWRLIPTILLGVLSVWFLADLWNSRRKRLKALKDPDNAPPAFGGEMPHEYQDGCESSEIPGQLVNCCWKCGGGKNHSVHHGVRFIPGAATAYSKQTEQLLQQLPNPTTELKKD